MDFKQIFLVDCENLNALKFIESKNLTIEDKVVLFLSEKKIMNLNYKDIDTLGTISFERIFSKGRNALDFQLIVYLSELIFKGVDSKLTIISNDKGYKSSILYIEHKYGIKVELEEYKPNIFLLDILGNPNSHVHRIDNFYTVNNNIFVKAVAYFLNVNTNASNEVAALIINCTDMPNVNFKLRCKYGKIRGDVMFQCIKYIGEESNFIKLVNSEDLDVALCELKKQYELKLFNWYSNKTKANVKDLIQVVGVSNSLETCHNKLLKHFGKQEGLYIYRILKQYLAYHIHMFN